jgi:molybdopterin/thiamine biosynthesis adenylyltransferase
MNSKNQKNIKDLTPAEIEKYARQITHPGFSIENQKNLKNSTILIAGIGGLGGAVAWGLAGAGIGKLVLVHAGNLDEPDLNRQTLMTSDWVGKPRIEKARETLLEFNPFLEIETHDVWIDENNFTQLVSGVDFVIDARHNFKERRIINKTCVDSDIPYIEAAMNGLEGYIFAVEPGKSACLECVYTEDPPWDPFGFSVFGAVASVTGSMAALEAVKYLSGYDKNIYGKMIYVDYTDLSTTRFQLKREINCLVCGNK